MRTLAHPLFVRLCRQEQTPATEPLQEVVRFVVSAHFMPSQLDSDISDFELKAIVFVLQQTSLNIDKKNRWGLNPLIINHRPLESAHQLF
jgi:hypothetical protein